MAHLLLRILIVGSAKELAPNHSLSPVCNNNLQDLENSHKLSRPAPKLSHFYGVKSSCGKGS